MITPLTGDEFEAFAKRYQAEFGYPLHWIHSDGSPCLSSGKLVDCACGGPSEHQCIEAARQTLAWGQPIIQLCCDDGLALWAVPIMLNNHITGAIMVQGIDLEGCDAAANKHIQTAADSLLEWMIEANWTNAAAFELAQQKAQREGERFSAIEVAKQSEVEDVLRSVYLREEPGLLMAIKEGRNNDARAALNRILSCIYAMASERIALLKSCLLELVVMMSRAAVEAGASPSLLLGNHFRSLTDLAEIEDEEELAVWIKQMLEVLVENIHRSSAFPNSLLLNRALQYMREHLDEPLRRDTVARMAGVSAGHLNHLLTERMGNSFSELLTGLRISRAKELLLQNRLTLTEIALECGFCDQSHLSKVFRKETGVTPGDYRNQWLKKSTD